MSAADIAIRLGKARREGRGWRTTCPVHNGYSLNLACRQSKKNGGGFS
jgi:hypothetical protein